MNSNIFFWWNTVVDPYDSVWDDDALELLRLTYLDHRL